MRFTSQHIRIDLAFKNSDNSKFIWCYLFPTQMKLCINFEGEELGHTYNYPPVTLGYQQEYYESTKSQGEILTKLARELPEFNINLIT